MKLICYAKARAAWQWRSEVILGGIRLGQSARLTFRPVAGRSEAWDIKGDAVPLRGRFCN